MPTRHNKKIQELSHHQFFEFSRLDFGKHRINLIQMLNKKQLYTLKYE